MSRRDSASSRARVSTIPSPTPVLSLPHGPLRFPAFLPDATHATVRAVDSGDLLACGVPAVVMNTFHLMQRPGSSTVQALGGLHAMSGWPHPIITDSGGFQAYSLIRQNAKYGSLTENGILFRPEGAPQRKIQLTPEKCIQLQMSYGADVLMCLDDCTHVDDPESEQRASVRRTIAWARRCKQEFERLLSQKRRDGDRFQRAVDHQRPLLFGVIQGGGAHELRRECAEALLDIGFDGFGYGGWPLDSQGDLLADLLAYTRQLVPAQLPMHALGVGHPASIAACWRMGYGLFDSALPTRDARHARLYTFARPPATGQISGDSWFSYLYISDEKFLKDRRPVSEHCDCPTCSRYSRGYLHHLFKTGEVSFQRLATIHNLRFMVQLTASLQAEQANRSQ
jgi:queuine tRNA-ribosyltransferase